VRGSLPVPGVAVRYLPWMIRVGLAGAGWVSEHHLDAWQTLQDRATVVAIADPALSAAQARAGRYGIPHAYASVEAMLDDVQLDALDIAAPREVHTALCRLAVQRGLTALCQKPLAPTLQEAEQLAAELEPRARVMVHDNWRFRPHYRQMQDWIQAGHIGELRTVNMMLFTSGLLPDATGRFPALVRQPMLARLERMLLMEVMLHHVDTLRFLLGPLTLLSAQLNKSCRHILGEDRASLLLRGANGSAVSLVGDFCAYGYPPEQRDRLEILGSDGAIFLRDDLLTLTGRTKQVLRLDLAANYKASYAHALAHFVDRLEDGAPFETSVADHMETLKIVEAAYQGRPSRPAFLAT
jgi:D-apiose dehydrogenase